jgi:NAD(P)-dependent dehydrogenase (short-subunit alcohol dehydrogenase family)
MKLVGRNAIITGANQGLGFEIARAYICEGANVLICARDKARLMDAQRDLAALAAAGQKVIAQVADVARDQDTASVVARALDEFGSVQILVNCAGIYAKGSDRRDRLVRVGQDD